MLEIIIFALLVVTAVEGLVTLLAGHPGCGRLLVSGCGLFLAVFMTITGVSMWAEPELSHGMALLFFLWPVFGVWLMAKAAKVE